MDFVLKYLIKYALRAFLGESESQFNFCIRKYKCFGKEFNFEQRFDTQPLTLAKQETKISNFTPNVLTTAQKISNAKASISCDLDPTQTELGLLLYPTDSNPKDLRGDYT